MTTSTLAYRPPQAGPPELESLGEPIDRRTRQRLVVAAATPLAISLGTNGIFFIAYWLPEMSGLPGHHWWLNQLAPLASRLVTSAGHAQVPAQTGGWDVPALLLLACSVAVFALCGTPRFWLGPAGIALPTLLGVVTAVVTVVVLLAGGHGPRSALSVLLLVAWVATALFATVHKVFDDPADHTALTRRSSLLPLAIYALLFPAPVAVGRMLFGRELRGAAVLLQGNTVAGRSAALTTPVSLLLYLVGLLVGVGVWLGCRWAVQRPGTARVALRLTVLLVVVVTLGWPTSALADHRAALLRTASPQHQVHFGCGSLVLDPADDRTDRPERTLVVTGFSCRTVTVFDGYRQQTSEVLPVALSPLRAHTPEGTAITSRLVVARYATSVVVAAGSRIDQVPDRVLFLDPGTGRLLGSFACGDGRSRPMLVRFARVPGGDDPAAGRVTVREQTPTVVVSCDGQTTRLDPTHPPAR